MSSPSPQPAAGSTPEFDQFAGDYDAALNRGISLSGEGKDYFIERRIDWTARCLARLNVPRTNLTLLDYGCGTGSAFPKLRDTFTAQRLIGIDVSTAELAIAKKDYPWSEVCTPDQTAQHNPSLDNTVDLAYSNGTFHHIPPDQRAAALALVYRTLKPGGLFALWENNPWNPGTRWVMSRIPFDRDAITLPPPKPSAAPAPPASPSSAPISSSSSPKCSPPSARWNRASPDCPWVANTRSCAENRNAPKIGADTLVGTCLSPYPSNIAEK